VPDFFAFNNSSLTTLFCVAQQRFAFFNGVYSCQFIGSFEMLIFYKNFLLVFPIWLPVFFLFFYNELDLGTGINPASWHGFDPISI